MRNCRLCRGADSPTFPAAALVPQDGVNIMALTTFDTITPAHFHGPASLWNGAATLAKKASAGIGTVFADLYTWRERARQRRLLLTLSDHMLKDVGITRADAEFEARKPCWTP